MCFIGGYPTTQHISKRQYTLFLFIDYIFELLCSHIAQAGTCWPSTIMHFAYVVLKQSNDSITNIVAHHRYCPSICCCSRELEENFDFSARSSCIIGFDKELPAAYGRHTYQTPLVSLIMGHQNGSTHGAKKQ